jgi:predicted nucleotidyltransferase
MTLAAFVGAVRQRFGGRVTAVTLFGSRARGEGRDDSDLDILVAVRDLARQDRLAVIDLAADVGLERGLVLSPLVVDAAAWRADLPIAQAIASEGVRL